MRQIFPMLATPRLILREIVPADITALFAIHSDAEAMRWYGVDPITKRSEAARLVDLFATWLAAGTGYRWALERYADARLIGTCGLFRWNKQWRNCMTGYELAHDCHAQGYMREALTAVLGYGFREMNLHRVQLETHPDNTASIGLATRLGFHFEGTHREQAFWAGSFHDLNCYSLLASEWHGEYRNDARRRN